MKRIVLFLATNIAVLVVLSVIVNLFGLDRWLTAEGIDYTSLLVFSAVIGFGGALISLLISKWMAKMSTGARVIDGSEGTTEYWLVEAVLGHEVAHVANGDMVTLTLIQGVVNTFVIFLSRIIGYIVDKAIFRTERGVGPGFFIASLVAQIVLGILASMIVAWFSRQREFRADAGSADLVGDKRPMINALARLGGVPAGDLPQALQAHGIKQSPSRLLGLFASHPPIEARIATLQGRG